MNKELRLLAFLSLGLLLAALLGPFIIAAFAHNEAPAVGFGLAAGFLALVFAAFSRADRIGRVVLTIVLTLLVLGVGSIPIIRIVRADVAKRERVKMERERQEAMRMQSTLMQREQQQKLKQQLAAMVLDKDTQAAFH